MTASKKSEKKSTPKEGTGVKINNSVQIEKIEEKINLLFKGLVEVKEDIKDIEKKLNQVTDRMGL